MAIFSGKPELASGPMIFSLTVILSLQVSSWSGCQCFEYVGWVTGRSSGM